MQNRTRTFIRHPSDVPIRISLGWVDDDVSAHPCDALDNISLGGLAFKSPKPLPLGQCVTVSFPLLTIQHNLSAKIVWVTGSNNHFQIGLQFNDANELYCLRMIEQICHIEHYRQEVAKNEGRSLTSEEAASEWIARYAELFPQLS